MVAGEGINSVQSEVITQDKRGYLGWNFGSTCVKWETCTCRTCVGMGDVMMTHCPLVMSRIVIHLWG